MRRLTVVEQSILEPCQSQFGRFFYKKKKIGFGESILTLTHVLPKGLVGRSNGIRQHSILLRGEKVVRVQLKKGTNASEFNLRSFNWNVSFVWS